MIERFLSAIGRPVLMLVAAVERFGSFVLFSAKLFPHFFTRPYRITEAARQAEIIGIKSLGIIVLTSVFIGMVQAIQIYQGFHKFGMEGMMGYTIFYAIGKELGPVVAALMVTSRAVSAMAAELGTMRVTEQIDAIETLAVDSKKLLIIPRIIAATLCLPILVIIFDVCSNLASYFIAVVTLDINPTSYTDTITQYAEFADFGTGLIKAAVFGFLISLIGSYCGYHTSGGARGVGISTTMAVVLASVTVLMADYFLASFFIYIGW